MAMSRKNMDEEKYLKTLREMASLPHNRQCFDCGQRGPTYINMTIGSFVCMTCGGLLRGLNPPHRVKSISMASFTAEEMDFIRSRGNDFCRKVWQNSRAFTQLDTKDELRIRDTMSDKYEKKRWYTPPQESMYEEARKQNATSDTKQTANKSLSSMIGNGPPILSSPDSQVSRPGLVQHSSSIQRPTGVGSAHLASGAQMTSSLASPRSPVAWPPLDHSQSAKPPAVDLLTDLGDDPFASPSTSQPSANFSAFAMFNSDQSMTRPTVSHLLQPASQHPSVTTATQSAPAAADKYLALAELDGVFSSAASATKVNWDALPSSAAGSRNSSLWVTSPSAGLPLSSPFGVSGNNLAGSNPFGMAASVQSPVYNPFVGNLIMAPGFGQPLSSGVGQYGTQQTGIGMGYGQFCAMPVAAGVQYGFPNGMWSGKMSMPVGSLAQPSGAWNQPFLGANPFMNTSVNSPNATNPFI